MRTMPSMKEHCIRRIFVYFVWYCVRRWSCVQAKNIIVNAQTGRRHESKECGWLLPYLLTHKFPIKTFRKNGPVHGTANRAASVALWAKAIPYVLKSIPNQTCWIFSPCQITDRTTWFQTCLGNKSQLLACFGPTNQKLSQIDMWHIRKSRRRMSPPKNNNKVIRSWKIVSQISRFHLKRHYFKKGK